MSSAGLHRSQSTSSYLKQQSTTQLPPITDSSGVHTNGFSKTLSPHTVSGGPSSELRSSASADGLSMLIDHEEDLLALQNQRRELASKSLDEMKLELFLVYHKFIFTSVVHATFYKASRDWKIFILSVVAGRSCSFCCRRRSRAA